MLGSMRSRCEEALSSGRSKGKEQGIGGCPQIVRLLRLLFQNSTLGASRVICGAW